MNAILFQIKTIMEENRRRYLKDVLTNELENNGAVFYMNSNNGTLFDWYVNGRLPYFMMFYHDERNMGAAKLSIKQNGEAKLFLYGDQGNRPEKNLSLKIEAESNEMMELAVLLKNSADDKSKWDADMETFDTDIEITRDMMDEFRRDAEFFKETIERRNTLNKTAVVSKKVIEEDWKIGIMSREKPSRESDSGWYFGAGNESAEYMEDAENFVFMVVGQIWDEIEPSILRYIAEPPGTSMIRISSAEFVEDDGKKEIFCEKRD